MSLSRAFEVDYNLRRKSGEPLLPLDFRSAPEPASDRSIEDLIAVTGPLPASWRRFLMLRDGGAFTNTIVTGPRSWPLGLNNIFSTSQIQEYLDVYQGRIPQWTVPFGYSDGDLFIISIREQDFGSVWHWDHDLEASEEELPSLDNIQKISDDLDSFLASLYKF